MGWQQIQSQWLLFPCPVEMLLNIPFVSTQFDFNKEVAQGHANTKCASICTTTRANTTHVSHKLNYPTVRIKHHGGCKMRPGSFVVQSTAGSSTTSNSHFLPHEGRS